MGKDKTPKWKREQVPDHKFDFVDVEEFYDPKCTSKISYTFVFLVVIKSFVIYIADLWTAGIILIFDKWNTGVQPKIPFYIGKWIYVGCILLSFLLLSLDIRKARMIIASKDISYATTSLTAYRYYSMRSYPHYCFFTKINDSRRVTDDIAFFVFFTLKGWKRLIFAEGPRQVIAGMTVFSIIETAWKAGPVVGLKLDWKYYGETWTQQVALMLMSFTCVLWIFSMIMATIACICYFPLLCHIQGNLKEYCCHKVDKRIAELLKKQSRKRVIQEKIERKQQLIKAQKTGGILPRQSSMPQPTLPNFDKLMSESTNYPTYRPAPQPPTVIYNPHSNTYGPTQAWNSTNPYSAPPSPPSKSATPGSTLNSKRSLTALVASQENMGERPLSPPPRPGRGITSPTQQEANYDANGYRRQQQQQQQDDRYAQAGGYYQQGDAYQGYNNYNHGYQQQGHQQQEYQQQGYQQQGYQQQVQYAPSEPEYNYGAVPPEDDYSHYGGYFTSSDYPADDASSQAGWDHATTGRPKTLSMESFVVLPTHAAGPVVFEDLPPPVKYSLDAMTYSASIESPRVQPRAPPVPRYPPSSPERPNRQFSLTPEPDAVRDHGRDEARALFNERMESPMMAKPTLREDNMF
ncbi:hypothetical protein BC936DRAFT_147953 [Jimgerdemannia flammicorona]|uniref:Vacuole protein n=1 Tax=Jimgerdemannia flammicorona TaxID=994334 RepID=A0A433D430_9FUNG|nr:hypothetical protein BC936DRAFT_147953 [Jimgerdemannia flammicorona]